MLSGRQVLEQLLAGNQRFAYGWAVSHPTEARRRELLARQTPKAAVLVCSDSRVPAELVFDQGLGELFVVRVAGNIVAPSQTASVEFAVERLRVPLVVVLGHTGCGAIRATLEVCAAALQRELEDGPARASLPGLGSTEPTFVRHSIVDRIRPAVEHLLRLAPALDPATLELEAVRANVRLAAHQLRNGSTLIESLVRSGALLVVGAEYSLETGLVHVFDGL